jgi:hypothetical protein
MRRKAKFDEVLDAVEGLPIEERAELLEVVRRRLAEQGRQRIVDDVRDARVQFKKGEGRRASVDDIMREIKS